MKTLIILVQAAVLVAAAWFTRPADTDFHAYVRRHMAAKADGLLSRPEADAHADAIIGQCMLRDRILWTEVVKDGRVIYVGALAHWFDPAAIERNDMSSAAFGPR